MDARDIETHWGALNDQQPKQPFRTGFYSRLRPPREPQHAGSGATWAMRAPALFLSSGELLCTQASPRAGRGENSRSCACESLARRDCSLIRQQRAAGAEEEAPSAPASTRGARTTWHTRTGARGGGDKKLFYDEHSERPACTQFTNDLPELAA